MKFGFGKPKLTVADIEREAQAEIDSAVKRAKPPKEPLSPRKKHSLRRRKQQMP